MAQVVLLEVVTPAGVTVRVEADQVEAPGVLGEFGVLPQHLPLLAAVRAGIVRYRHAGKVFAVAVEGGFAEVASDRVTVLSARAIAGDNVDVAAVRQNLEQRQQAIEARKGDSGVDLDALLVERDWLSAQLEAAREVGHGA